MILTFSDLRQCPHCGEIWAKIIGCEGQTTCGNLCRFADTKGKDHVRDFANFTFERVGKKFVIKRGGIRARNKNNNVENNTGKRGCGRYINWSSMQPVPVPPEFDAKVDISVEDVEVGKSSNFAHLFCYMQQRRSIPLASVLFGRLLRP